jgi:hypothetical protein
MEPAAACLHPFRNQSRGARIRQQPLQPARLGDGDLAAERREAIIATAFVVVAAGAFVELFDQAVFQHSMDRTIERAGAEADSAFGPRCDVLHDGVAVAVMIRERYQDVESVFVERKEILGVVFRHTVTIPFSGIPKSGGVIAAVFKRLSAVLRYDELLLGWARLR